MRVCNKKIEVIMLQKVGAKPIPLRFRIFENNEYIVVKDLDIEMIKTIYENRKPVFIYRCKAVINDYTKNIELRFYPNIVKWVLYKI